MRIQHNRKLKWFDDGEVLLTDTVKLSELLNSAEILAAVNSQIYVDFFDDDVESARLVLVKNENTERIEQ